MSADLKHTSVGEQLLLVATVAAAFVVEHDLVGADGTVPLVIVAGRLGRHGRPRSGRLSSG